MKLTRTASGKPTVRMSKSEWQRIGKKAGWMRTAGAIANLLPAIMQGDQRAAKQASSLLASAAKGTSMDQQDHAAIQQLAGLAESATDPSVLELAESAKEYLGGGVRLFQG